ncbi:MAG: transglycosylase domain-containing protein [Candidatus Babeliales bacterium]
MFLKLLLRLFIFCFVISTAFVSGVMLYVLHNKSVDFSALENYNPGLPTIVLDDQGTELMRFQLDRRDPIPLDVMPKHLINAFIAAEDWSFFKHAGISWKGIIRSLCVNLYHGRIVQGASTITQQLIKLLFFDSQKTLSRKIKEQLLALIVEQQFTKEQILNTYLNHVYFGYGIYGVEAASQRFWGKSAAQVTIDEAAVLAAVVRSPGSYCPLTCPLSAQRRRDVILRSMRTLASITHDEYTQACKQSLHLVHDEPVVYAPHARESLRVWLENQIGKTALYTVGLTVQTTLNKDMQCKAEHYFKEQFSLLRKTIASDIDGALITMHGATGDIKAMVGGFDYAQSKFNRALQAKRQMGSTFKPLVYVAALQEGMTFADTALDEPLELQQGPTIWSPKNATGEFEGEITLAYALSHSNNIVAIKTLLAVGIDQVIALAQQCHLSAERHPYPSLALGCLEATVLDVVGMFNIFAHDGVYVEPHMVSWIKDRWGKKVWKWQPGPQQVITSVICSQVTKVLTLGLERVRSYHQGPWIKTEGISKTGTTNDSRTCWYVGSTPDYTTAIYLGRDDNSPMGKNVFPVTTEFPIWLSLMRELPYTRTHFSYDPSLRTLCINEMTGRIMRNHDDPEAISILV